MATSPFGKAFAAARKSGEKTFEFNGKKYTTELASEAKQPSVGGKVTGEYKSRAPYGDRGNTMTEKNQVRRDMSSRMDEIDRETQGDAMAMKYVPRDRYSRQGQSELSENYKPRRTPESLTSTDKPGTSTRYENEDATSETFKKGGSTFRSSANGIAQRGKTRGKFV